MNENYLTVLIEECAEEIIRLKNKTIFDADVLKAKYAIIDQLKAENFALREVYYKSTVANEMSVEQYLKWYESTRGDG